MIDTPKHEINTEFPEKLGEIINLSYQKALNNQ